MKIKRYQRKGVVDALRWEKDNLHEIEDFIGAPRFGGLFAEEKHPEMIRIKNMGGAIYAKQGDYIIRDDTGECFPVSPSVFYMTYEEVED